MTGVEVYRTQQSYIQKRPGVSGGIACIRDSRVPVWSLVTAWRRGVSTEDLRDYFVTPLTEADVQAALDYFERQKQEIEEETRLNEEA